MANLLLMADRLLLNGNLAGAMGASPGDTLFIAARTCTLQPLPGDYHYTIVTPELNVLSSPIIVNGVPSNPSPRVDVWALDIVGTLGLISKGATGPIGSQGMKGADGKCSWNQKGLCLADPMVGGAGRDGGSGGQGGTGANGGTAVIDYVSASGQVTASAPGGDGGSGGPGGLGGRSCGGSFTAGKKGITGPSGLPGQPGLVIINQLELADFWYFLMKTFDQTGILDIRKQLFQFFGIDETALRIGHGEGIIRKKKLPVLKRNLPRAA